MDEVEIGRLIVRLVGDPSSFQAMLAGAQQKAAEVAGAVGKFANQVEGFGAGLKGLAGTVLDAFGRIGVGVGLMSAFEKFEEKERGIIRFNAALRANGEIVAAVSEDYMRFAKQLSETTLLSKGATMQLLQQSLVMGMTGEEAKKAVRTAQALAAAQGGDPAHFLRVQKALDEGNAQMLRYMLHMRGVHDEGEILAQAQQRIAAGAEIVKAEMETSSAKIEKVKQSLGGFVREVGGLLAAVIIPVIDGVKALSDWFNSLDPTVRRAVAAVAALAAVAYSFGGVLPLVVAGIKGVLSGVSALTVAMYTNPFTFWVAAIGALVAVSYVLVKAFSDADRRIAELNRRAQEYVAGRAKETQEEVTNILANAPPVFEGDAESLEEHQRYLIAHMAEQQRIISDTQRVIREGEAAGRDVEPARKLLEVHQDALNKLRAAYRQAGAPAGTSAEAIDLTKKAMKEIDSLVKSEGMRGAQLTAFNAVYDKKLSQNQKDIVQTGVLMREQRKYNDSVRDAREALEDQLATMGMTAGEAEVYKLSMKAAREGVKALTDAEKDRILGLHRQADVGNELKKILEAGPGVTEQFLTPEEKYRNRLEDLNLMVEAGAISWITYGRATRGAAEELERAAGAAERMDAVALGSAGHVANLLAYARGATAAFAPPSVPGGAPPVLQQPAGWFGPGTGGAPGLTPREIPEKLQQQLRVQEQIRDAMRQWVAPPGADFDPFAGGWGV